MSIKVWSYLDEYYSEKSSILKAIEEVLESGTLILGDKVSAFEGEFSSYCGCAYGVGVNSATDALFLAMKTLNIGVGDEVITVSNTAVPTVSAIVATGATPIFVDIDPLTYLMDVSKIKNVITKNTKCIIPVHLFGQCVNMSQLYNTIEGFNIKIIEDCSQSHGAKFDNKLCGSFGDMSVFSFYPTKILGGYGDAGMILTNNKVYYSKLKRLRFYGMDKTYYSEESGYNSRLDEIHASILLTKLQNLDKYISRRREIAYLYNKELKNCSICLPTELENNFHSYYLYVVRHSKRDEIINKLKDNGIFVNISYPFPIHTMTGYSYLGYKKGDLPITEKIANEIFSLPMYPSLKNEDVLSVCEVLKMIL